MPEAAPSIFIIFGITGDLAQKKLLPALYHLIKDDLLHEQTAFVGLSRKQLSVDDLLDKVELCVLETDKVCDPVVLQKFRDRLSMAQLDPVNEADYARLHDHLQVIEDQHGVCMNRLFYLAIPPQIYQPVIHHLGQQHLQEGCVHHRAVSRLLVEKPFGYDLASAIQLIDDTARYFSETQLFRIDHYLAKETAQNILVFREHNPSFADLWDNQHVRGIDLHFDEKIGVEGRAAFYDNVGALRDVVQNHVLQLLTLVTMELPSPLTSAAIHVAKQAILQAVRSVDPDIDTVIRAQYAGYREEVENPGSATETYVQLPLTIDNDRWRGVPISVTAGKALAAKQTSIRLTFTDENDQADHNYLTFRIQPNEGIDTTLTVKEPGFVQRTEEVNMDFSYQQAFAGTGHPDAYERVLVDAMKGDHSLFATSEEVLESWRIIQPILTKWEQGSDDLLMYEPGSDGPSQDQAPGIQLQA